MDNFFPNYEKCIKNIVQALLLLALLKAPLVLCVFRRAVIATELVVTRTASFVGIG